MLHLLASALVSALLAPPVESGATAFVDVTVIPMDEPGARGHQTVVVEAGTITAMGPVDEVSVPEDATRIDGAGRCLVPGLADMHVHVPAGDGAEGTPSWRALSLLLANGVTTARGLAGHPSHPALRARLESGDVLGPTFVAAGPALHVNSVKSVEEAVAAVRAQKAAGYDLVKSHHVTDPAIYDAIQATAKDVGLPVAGHVADEIGLARAAAARQQIEHLDGFVRALLKDGAEAEPFGQFPPLDTLLRLDERKLAPLAEDLAQQQVWNTPTLALFEAVVDVATPTEALLARPELRYVAAAARAQWATQRDGEVAAGAFAAPYGEKFTAVRRSITKALASAGAPLLAGSDSPQHFLVAGFALHDELGALVRAGLTPWQALAAATANPARYLGRDVGAVEIGRRADLLLLDRNPLDDIAATRSIRGVMVRGRYLDRAALDALLEAVATSAGES